MPDCAGVRGDHAESRVPCFAHGCGGYSGDNRIRVITEQIAVRFSKANHPRVERRTASGRVHFNDARPFVQPVSKARPEGRKLRKIARRLDLIASAATMSSKIPRSPMATICELQQVP